MPVLLGRDILITISADYELTEVEFREPRSISILGRDFLEIYV